MSNGYEMQAQYYSEDSTRHLYPSQPDNDGTSQFEEEDLNDSQAWGEWDNGSLSSNNQQSAQLPMDQSNTGEVYLVHLQLLISRILV